MTYKLSLLPFIKRYILWSKMDCNLGFASTRCIQNTYNEHGFDEYVNLICINYKKGILQLFSLRISRQLHIILFHLKQFMNERLNAGASNEHPIQIWKKSRECIVMLRNVKRFLTVHFNNMNACVAQCQMRENKFWYTSNSK